MKYLPPIKDISFNVYETVSPLKHQDSLSNGQQICAFNIYRKWNPSKKASNMPYKRVKIEAFMKPFSRIPSVVTKGFICPVNFLKSCVYISFTPLKSKLFLIFSVTFDGLS